MPDIHALIQHGCCVLDDISKILPESRQQVAVESMTKITEIESELFITFFLFSPSFPSSRFCEKQKQRD